MIRKFTPLFAALLAWPMAVTAQDGPLSRKIFESETEGAIMPTVSPDERWLVYVRDISNQETQLVLRPFRGGQPRVLEVGKAFHLAPHFTPQGDRLVIVSNLVRRDASDDGTYLLSAPFDTRTGTLTGPFRQISLDPIRVGGAVGQYSISPDGQSVAFFGMTANVIRVVPMAGGNSRIIANPTAGRPSGLVWSADGQAVFYNLFFPGDSAIRVRVPVDGSPSKVVAVSQMALGLLSPDNRYAISMSRAGRNTHLRILSLDGRELGALDVTGGRWEPVVGGKYLVSQWAEAPAPINVVPVAGGPIRPLTDGGSSDWPDGWSVDGRTLWVEKAPGTGPGADSVNNTWVGMTLNGQTTQRLTLPPGTTGPVLQDGDYFVYATLPARFPDFRFIRVNLKDGGRKELTGPTLQNCRPVAAGGMYYGGVGTEFYYAQKVGRRIQFRAMNIEGTSRLIADLPEFGCEDEPSVFRDRLVFLARGDSARVRYTTGAGSAPRTLLSFGPAERIDVLAWSKDGRQLAVGVESPKQHLLIFQFDDNGMPVGSPRKLTLPFEYWYEAFWLADGSGFTMIAQPRGTATTEIALVKLADPEHPVMLTRDDPHSVWGHALSPDGKTVAYPSETGSRKSVFYLIEMAEVLKRIGVTK